VLVARRCANTLAFIQHDLEGGRDAPLRANAQHVRTRLHSVDQALVDALNAAAVRRFKVWAILANRAPLQNRDRSRSCHSDPVASVALNNHPLYLRHHTNGNNQMNQQLMAGVARRGISKNYCVLTSIREPSSTITPPISLPRIVPPSTSTDAA
jgi:hypothetical protein